MKIVWRLLLAVAALFVMPVAVAWAQGNTAEAKQDQVKEAAREVDREGIIVDGATGAPIAGATVTMAPAIGAPVPSSRWATRRC